MRGKLCENYRFYLNSVSTSSYFPWHRKVGIYYMYVLQSSYLPAGIYVGMVLSLGR